MRSRKLMSLALALVLVIGGSMAAGSIRNVFANRSVAVVLNGNALNFDVPAQIINERTMVPYRGIAEAMGAEVLWDENLQEIVMYLNNSYAIMQVNDSRMTFGQFSIDTAGNITYETTQELVMDSPPVIVDDRTLVPLRAISESLGAMVNWDSATFSVSIATPVPQPTPVATPTPLPPIQDEEPGFADDPVVQDDEPEEDEEEEEEEPAFAMSENGIYSLDHVNIAVDLNNPRRATITLRNINIPSGMNVVPSSDITLPVFSVAFSSDGTNYYGVSSEPSQGVTGIVAAAELNTHLYRETASGSTRITNYAPRLVRTTANNIVWEVDLPANASVDLTDLSIIAFMAVFYEDNMHTNNIGIYSWDDNEWQFSRGN